MKLPQEILRIKRDGMTLSDADIAEFIAGVTQGSISDSQIAAFTMEVFLKGMSLEENVALTRAMRDSGQVLAWDLPGPVVDKHSTGGVGDVVSLMLGPLVAACGGYVPMISGRGLGHTGGTLDKFESIPGYNTAPDLPTLRRVVREVGVAIIGQTADLAPADKRIYAVRDVTATVESIPLITASILSKKLSAGLDALVMDVKSGSGAFMPTHALSLELAQRIVHVGNGAGMKTRALITDMSQPLAPAAGNALEVRVALDYLSGRARPQRLHRVTLALAAEMLRVTGLAADAADAEMKLLRALETGAAAERFARMVVALGGPADLFERPDAHLASAPLQRPVYAESAGVVAAMDTRGLGLAVCALGGGRSHPDDVLDMSVGLTGFVELGQRVASDTPLCVIHAASEEDWQEAARRVRAAITVADAAPPLADPVGERITEN